MKGTVKISVNRSDIVPSDGRVQWIETHGVIPESINVECVADLAEWEAAGAIVATDGTVECPAYQDVHGAIRTALKGHLRADPTARRVGVTPILRAVVEAKAEKAAREEAAARSIAAEIAAMPMDAVLSPVGEYLSPQCSAQAKAILDSAFGSGAYAEGLARTLATDTIDALREERWRRRDVERERVAAATEAGRQAVRAWVVELGDAAGLPSSVVRAAREGRDVSRVVRDEVERRVREAIDAAIPSQYQGRGQAGTLDMSYSLESDQRAPSLCAYDVRDAIVSAQSAIAAAAMVPGVAVEVSDFMRVAVTEKPHAWRSGIDVTVTHPWWPDYDLGYAVLTEPLALSSDDSE